MNSNRRKPPLAAPSESTASNPHPHAASAASVFAPLQAGVALIGCGQFARQIMLPALAAEPLARLRWVCDLSSDLAAAAALQFHAERWCTDVKTVWQDPAVDAVVITVRDDAQASLTLQALEAGKHVYVEKPLADRMEVFARLREMRDRVGRLVAVGFQKRFAPAYRAFKAAVDQAGGPSLLYCRMADDAWRWAQGYPPGYLVRHDACHLFDLLHWITGAEVVAVHAYSPKPDDDAISLIFSSKAAAVLLHSGHASMDFPKERTEALVPCGAVVMEDFVEVHCYGFPDLPATQRFGWQGSGAAAGWDAWRNFRRMAWERWRSEGGTPACIPNFLRDQGWRAALHAFLEAVLNRAPFSNAGVEDAQAAARVVAAVEESRRTGRIVELPPGAEIAVGGLAQGTSTRPCGKPEQEDRGTTGIG